MTWVEKRVRDELRFRGFSKHTIEAYARVARKLDEVIKMKEGNVHAAIESFNKENNVERAAVSFIRKEILGEMSIRKTYSDINRDNPPWPRKQWVYFYL